MIYRQPMSILFISCSRFTQFKLLEFFFKTSYLQLVNSFVKLYKKACVNLLHFPLPIDVNSPYL